LARKQQRTGGQTTTTTVFHLWASFATLIDHDEDELDFGYGLSHNQHLDESK
jgi:hypothetical protein